MIESKRCRFCGGKIRFEKGRIYWMIVCESCGLTTDIEIDSPMEDFLKKYNNRNGARIEEIEYIKAFAREADFSSEICRDQLRSLWTAYCLRHNLIVDTFDYDIDLVDLWDVVKSTESDTGDWGDREEFNNFLAGWLV